MADEGFVIGVDGGGSKTVSVVIDMKNKTEVGRGVSGGTNHNSIGEEKASTNLKESISKAVENAKIDYSKVRGICLGMSGVDREKDKAMVRRWLKDIFGLSSESQLPSVQIHSDAVIALASGTNGKIEGVVVICGTGMISFGGRNGELTRAGGWGNLLDDGAGYCIALAAVKAVVRAADGRGKPTLLTEAVLKYLNITTEEELIPWAYSKDMSWDKMAALLPLVLDAHAKKDEVATSLLQDAAGHLFDCINAVVHKLKFENDQFTVVLSGGVLTHDGSVVAKLLTERLKNTFSSVRITTPLTSPEVAAALIVFESLH